MTPAVLAMTATLRDELAANSLVDPRTVPWRLSNLMAMGRSPAHALHSFTDQREQTLSMRLGSGTHAMLFGQPYAVFEGKVRRGKEWDAFESAHANSLILNRTERDHALAMANSIRSNALASKLLFADDVIHERTIIWKQDGRDRRSTPDARGKFHLVELKSTKSAVREKFARDALYCGYYAQLADQAAAIEAETGTRPWEVYIVAVENTAPYVTQVFRIDARGLEIGERQRMEWFRRMCSACDEWSWPGYSSDVVPLEPPEWSEKFVAEIEAEEP